MIDCVSQLTIPPAFSVGLYRFSIQNTAQHKI